MLLGVDHVSFDSVRAEADICRSAGYYWPNRDFIMVCERPRAICRDDSGRLHNGGGPSVDYGETFRLYSWHGTTIPATWITDPGTLTAQAALTWPNVEQRRAACEIVGWHRILAELKSRVVDDSGDSEIGQLIEVSLPDSGQERFLRVRCGTGREFALPVPREMRTAIAAQAWTWGLSADEFQKPEVRT